jgi:hypothetical protein
MTASRDKVWVVYRLSAEGEGVEYEDTFASEEYAKEFVGDRQGFHIVPLGIDEFTIRGRIAEVGREIAYKMRLQRARFPWDARSEDTASKGGG